MDQRTAGRCYREAASFRAAKPNSGRTFGGSIIVKAEERSGSISQAKICVEIQCSFFAVIPEDDGNSLGLHCSGMSFLGREHGAIPIRTRADYEDLQAIVDSSKTQLRKKTFA